MARIMVCDDERDVVTLIRFLLQKDGHQITEAYDGKDALEKLGVDPKRDDVELPELIIIDVMMPVLDGCATAARLREDPAASKIPLIVLTAKGQMRDLFGKSPNVAAYIEKPFNPKDLRDMVTGMLAGKR